MPNLEPLLNEKQAAEILGTVSATLRTWRCRGKGPAYVRLGDAIRYAPQALREYIEARTRHPIVAHKAP
jgi:predicted site-specific integrase-resolvase